MQDFKQRGRPKGSKQEPAQIAEPVAPAMLKNVSSQRQVLYGKIVHPGVTYKLTDSDKADNLASKRAANAVDCGFLEWV
jgi:hypothetical protein